jgi:Fe-S-cluster containining protein
VAIDLDLEDFDRRAAAAADENWEFRTFLKGCDLSPRRVDLAVRRHYDEVARQVDCTACGRCCTRLTPLLLVADVRRLARAVGLSEADFRGRYAREAKDPGEGGAPDLVLRGPPCPFLAERKCTVYEHRPADCRCYPHLHKKDFVFRLFGVVGNAAICPIVHLVMERLKAELWDRGGP